MSLLGTSRSLGAGPRRDRRRLEVRIRLRARPKGDRSCAQVPSSARSSSSPPSRPLPPWTRFPPAPGLRPVPAYADVGTNPNVAISGDPAAWTTPACLGWPEAEARVVVALAGRFEADGMDAVVARVGRVSDFARTRYWSTSREQWRPLFDTLVPLSAPDPKAQAGRFRARRADARGDGLLPRRRQRPARRRRRLAHRRRADRGPARRRYRQRHGRLGPGNDGDPQRRP